MTNREYLDNDEWVALIPYATNCSRWARLIDKHAIGLCGSDTRAMQRIYNYLIRNALAVHHGRFPKRDMAVEREAAGWIELILSAELEGMMLAEWWDDVPSDQVELVED